MANREGMLVIVEGIDRVGKTTLCDALEGKGFIKLKDNYGTVSDKDKHFRDISLGKVDTMLSVAKTLVSGGNNVVIDRLHLTEYVYGSLDRRSTYETAALITDKYIKETFKNSLLVLVQPTSIEQANKRAGRDLRAHNQKFNDVFDLLTMVKITTNFGILRDALAGILVRANTYRFYFASPFFNPEQVEREERLKAKLRGLGFSVFSPKESCHLNSNADEDSQREVFNSNCNAIHSSEAVFAITDGKDVGTIWEAGYAFGIRKPVLYYAETLGTGKFNLMLARSGMMAIQCENTLTTGLLEALLYGAPIQTFGGAIE